jgi:hypothetical protein
MASTNIDKSKIDLAGVDSGAKMFEMPVDEELVDLADAGIKDQSKNANA